MCRLPHLWVGVWFCGLVDGWVFLLTFWYLTAYLKHLSPLQGFFFFSAQVYSVESVTFAFWFLKTWSTSTFVEFGNISWKGVQNINSTQMTFGEPYILLFCKNWPIFTGLPWDHGELQGKISIVIIYPQFNHVKPQPIKYFVIMNWITDINILLIFKPGRMIILRYLVAEISRAGFFFIQSYAVLNRGA